jgi:hypothetical protein
MSLPVLAWPPAQPFADETTHGLDVMRSIHGSRPHEAWHGSSTATLIPRNRITVHANLWHISALARSRKKATSALLKNPSKSASLPS